MVIRDPSDRLKNWLHKAGRPVDHVEVRNDQFGRFLEEAHEIYPHVDAPERLDLVLYNCVCHPGRATGEEPPFTDTDVKKSLSDYSSAPTSTPSDFIDKVHSKIDAMQKALKSLSPSRDSSLLFSLDKIHKSVEGLRSDLRDLPKQITLKSDSPPISLKQEPKIPIIPPIWDIAWRIAVIILLSLLLASTSSAQIPHDPLIIRTKDQGVTLTTRPAGLLEIDCQSGMSCSQVGNTFTLTSTGGGAGDDVQVNAVSSTNINFNNTNPAAPANAVNVKWQLDTVPAPDAASAHLLLSDVSTGTFGSGAGFNWTFDASAGVDSIISFGNGTVNVSTGTLQQGGVPVSLVDGIDCSSPATLTLDAAGAITTSGSACYFLDTFSAASTDDLETVNCSAGERFIFAPLDDARTVVVKAGVGINILSDFSLDNVNDSMVMWCKASNTLAELSRNSGGL